MAAAAVAVLALGLRGVTCPPCCLGWMACDGGAGEWSITPAPPPWPRAWLRTTRRQRAHASARRCDLSSFGRCRRSPSSIAHRSRSVSSRFDDLCAAASRAAARSLDSLVRLSAAALAAVEAPSRLMRSISFSRDFMRSSYSCACASESFRFFLRVIAERFVRAISALLASARAAVAVIVIMAACHSASAHAQRLPAIMSTSAESRVAALFASRALAAAICASRWAARLDVLTSFVDASAASSAALAAARSASRSLPAVASCALMSAATCRLSELIAARALSAACHTAAASASASRSARQRASHLALPTSRSLLAATVAAEETPPPPERIACTCERRSLSEAESASIVRWWPWAASCARRSRACRRSSLASDSSSLACSWPSERVASDSRAWRVFSESNLAR